MSNTNTGGPAFPVTEDNYVHKDNTGMTLRDYFASRALQSLLAHDAYLTKTNVTAERAYGLADAMLKAREA
jgi:hypothetical protein